MAHRMNPHEAREERGSWQSEVEKLGELWCGFMHDSPRWPIHGQYECGQCGRRHPVPWAQPRIPPAADFQAARI